MKLTCPYCNNKFSIDESRRTEVLCDLMKAVAGFGEHCDLVWEYTGAFAAGLLGPVSPAKRLRIVGELRRLWSSGVFRVQGKRYRTTRDKIIDGMRTVCDLEKHGFRNHNYLKRVLVQDAERISAEGMTAAEEKRREEDKRVKRSEGENTETLTPEAMAQLKKKLGVTRFSELIGKNIKEKKLDNFSV